MSTMEDHCICSTKDWSAVELLITIREIALILLIFPSTTRISRVLWQVEESVLCNISERRTSEETLQT